VKSAKQIDACQQRARLELIRFAQEMIPGFAPAPHLRLIAEKLEAVERGEIKRLIISCPPRHGKSWLVSRAFAAWWFGRHPRHYIIGCSHTQELATDFGREVRNDMQDPIFQGIFPGVKVRKDSGAAARFHVTGGGVYIGAGVNGPITGKGAHLLLIDDPIKNQEEADSPTYRAKMKAWFRSTAYTRLMPHGAIVIVQTRWHEDDLAGWVQDELKGQNWEVLNLPAICDDLDDPMHRELGDALWPVPAAGSEHCFPAEVLAETKEAVGAQVWNALYQGRPSPAEGGQFKRAWMEQCYALEPEEQAKSCTFLVCSWDLNVKDLAKSDYAVGQVWGCRLAQRFLLDQVRARMGFVSALAAVKALRAKWPQANAILIEDAANGPAVIDSIRNEIPGVIAINPRGSKPARAASVTPLWQAGNVWLPHAKYAPWLSDFVEEHAAFPAGKNDDQVDAETQALEWLRFNVTTQTDIRPVQGTRTTRDLGGFAQMR